MFRKNYLTLLSALFFLIAGSFTAFSQTAPVSGKVQLTKADGTVVPVEGAMVEVFRTDIKTKLPSDKTGKKGDFAFAGLPLGANFILSVSAPGAKPGYLPNVKAGNEKLLITLSEGDGKRWTEEEIRQAVSGAATGSATTTQQPTAESKKAEAERLKQIAEYESKKKKVETENETITKAMTDGNTAFNAKNYDLAITKYDEGIAASPDYVGSAPILLNNKGVALKIRAIENYNKAVKTTDAAAKTETLAKVKQDLEDALTGFNRSWTLLKNAPAAEITNQVNHDKAKYDALNGLTDAYRLIVVTKTNPAKAAESKEAFDAYLALETDAAKKAKAQLAYGEVMIEAGESEKAVAAYQMALTNSPDSPDALAGLGFSLVNLGFINNDKAKLQEGANYLQKFVKLAPDSHKFKDDAVGLIETLKTEQNVAPQNVSGSKKKN